MSDEDISRRAIKDGFVVASKFDDDLRRSLATGNSTSLSSDAIDFDRRLDRLLREAELVFARRRAQFGRGK